jgi:outer membrane receptor protein involved in Fe transport
MKTVRYQQITRMLPAIIASLLTLCWSAAAQTPSDRQIRGAVSTRANHPLARMNVIATGPGFERMVETGDSGQFSLSVPNGEVILRVEGPYVVPNQRTLLPDELSDDIRLQIDVRIPPIHQSIGIVASGLQPTAETYDADVFRKTLFARDDQLLDALAAGINAGQHEGGGKSLEVRRFGYNTDHGGVNGGLKILVDNVQQNQGTQGHGQGYLGSLKSLTPELVGEVRLVNGPFSPEYGDFSGLGVVHIQMKESLSDRGTIRLQSGSFGSSRAFMALSPAADRADSFIAYEGSRTDGPFDTPLGYKRDNITGNLTRRLSGDRALGFKLNFGRNDYLSSGQIPLDLVESGEVSRFGAIDTSNGGRVRQGTMGMFYRSQLASGASLKVDGFVSRSLFDLYSNFTLFLNNPDRGDGIQQHDSRVQEGFNSQYLMPFRLGANQALLTLGTNYHDNQINVGLYAAENRSPYAVTTRGVARVTNTAGYAQQSLALIGGRLTLDGGLRWDYFRFRLNDRVNDTTGVQGASRLQPKAGLSYTPSRRVPLTFSLHYGRGINTQDARGVIANPDTPRIAATDFYQASASISTGRFSLVANLFLIDRSNEQVYIPDDGSFELADPSRAYGYEGKGSVQLNRFVSLNGGVTQIMNSFYRNTSPRVYVDSAPHMVGNAGVTLAGLKGFFTSLRWRHTSNYRLDGSDASIRASGLDVLDLSMTKSLRHGFDLNLSFDNLTNKRYYETQNYFESRVSPTAEVAERIHATPGYPFGFTLGLTFRFGEK